jgi:hypothetical protein
MLAMTKSCVFFVVLNFMVTTICSFIVISCFITLTSESLSVESHPQIWIFSNANKFLQPQSLF